MQVEFSDPSYAIDGVNQVLVRFYAVATGVLKHTAALNGSAFTLVPASAPPRYRSVEFTDKPSTVVTRNLAGDAVESAPSAPFSLDVPATPTDLVVINPQG